MKILIGVDDSPHAEAAVEYVARMTWPTGTKVVLASAVTVLTPVFAGAYPDLIVQSDQLAEEILKTRGDHVAKLRQRLEKAGLKTETKVLQADARELLVSLVPAEGIDLLVVGSHGRSGVSKLLMGSVATHIVTHAPCNVLVIKKV